MSDVGKLWKLSGGSPKVSVPVTFLAGGGAQDLIALSGADLLKRIVPVWLYIGSVGGANESTEITVDGKTSGAILFKTGMNGRYCQSPVIHFGGMAMDLLSIGETLQGTTSAVATNSFFLTVGYYLI